MHCVENIANVELQKLQNYIAQNRIILYNKIVKKCRNNKICLFLNSTEIPHMHTYKHLLVFTETLELPMWLSGKESACQCRRCGFHPWVGKIPWRRKWQPTPILLPEKSHGAWQVAVHGCLKELDMTQQLINRAPQNITYMVLSKHPVSCLHNFIFPFYK